LYFPNTLRGSITWTRSVLCIGREHSGHDAAFVLLSMTIGNSKIAPKNGMHIGHVSSTLNSTTGIKTEDIPMMAPMKSMPMLLA